MLAYTGGLFFDPLSSVPVGRSFTVGNNSMKDTPKGKKTLWCLGRIDD